MSFTAAAGLSVIVITQDESERLRGCLESIAFANEVVVVDSGSKDDTVSIARSMGARVTETADWPGFGPQKNRALDLAAGPWILSIDADERVTPQLQAAILAALSRTDFDAWALDRRSSYCGQFMAHSGWSPDYLVRLFRKGSAHFSSDLVHESLQLLAPAVRVGRIDATQGQLLHESFTSLESVLDKVNRYSTAGAQALHGKGVKGSLGKAVGHGLWAFLRTYIFKRGFLDGRMGLALAISNAEGTYYRYLKLWLMQRRGASG